MTPAIFMLYFNRDLKMESNRELNKYVVDIKDILTVLILSIKKRVTFSIKEKVSHKTHVPILTLRNGPIYRAYNYLQRSNVHPAYDLKKLVYKSANSSANSLTK